MKKYEKPQLFMEEFTLNEHIAQCSLNHDTEHKDMIWDFVSEIIPKFYADSCHIEINDDLQGIIHLFSSAPTCDRIYGDDYILEGCYQGQSGGSYQFFGS